MITEILLNFQDELGRGTSEIDGEAIASAVLKVTLITLHLTV
jgi:DNA mismatch repair ATPase MutS